MEVKTIILDSELEFRDYVVHYSRDIKLIVIFEDILDYTIFFYCFTKKGDIVASKEPSRINFLKVKNNYIQLANKLNIVITFDLKGLSSIAFTNN